MNINTVRRVRHRFIQLIILCCTLAMFGCDRSTTSVGKYVSDKNPQDYTELKNDGTFFIHQGNLSASGKYSIEGKRLILVLSSGEIATGSIEGKTITDNEGSRSTKQ